MKKGKVIYWLLQIVITFTFILITGCEKLEIGEPFDCKIGTKYRINGGLSFTIDSLNDYRCPANLICIWSGDVDLYFNINQNFKHIDTLIYFYTRNRNPFQIGDYTWRVLEINPLGKSNELIDPKDYKIKMILLKN